MLALKYSMCVSFASLIIPALLDVHTSTGGNDSEPRTITSRNVSDKLGKSLICIDADWLMLNLWPVQLLLDRAVIDAVHLNVSLFLLVVGHHLSISPLCILSLPSATARTDDELLLYPAELEAREQGMIAPASEARTTDERRSSLRAYDRLNVRFPPRDRPRE